MNNVCIIEYGLELGTGTGKREDDLTFQPAVEYLANGATSFHMFPPLS